MVTSFSTLLKTLATFAAVIALPPSAVGLETGEYYRPLGAEVSGFPDAATPYVRSPCPALNTLANHGHIPRDGKNISRATLHGALVAVYNLDDGVASKLTNAIPDPVSLAYLSTHGFIEHDASLVHADSDTKRDPAALDETLAADLLGRAKDGRLGTHEVAGARKDRLQRCKAKGDGRVCTFGMREAFLAYGESALLLLGLGGKHDESISVAHATSFLVEERIPSDFKKAETPITNLQLLATAAKLQLLAPFQ